MGNGSIVDLSYVENEDSLLKREYDGVQVSANYRRERWTVGGNYTWSQSRGNWDGETSVNGPIRSGILQYPEYKDVSWWAPEDYLSIDQRHRARVFAGYDLIASRSHNLNVSLLHSYMSGTPYGVVGTISLLNRNVAGNPAYITNPGYRNPPTTTAYSFTSPSAYRTDDIQSTDIALNYSFFFGGFGKRFELFIQPEVLNVFNNDGVMAVNTTVRTRANAAGYQTFNPFTETPVEGVHWDKGPDFGKPTLPGSYQAPRTFRVSVGFRF
jgi:hypothetical protein